MLSIARKRFNSWATEHQLLFAVMLFNLVDFFTTRIIILRSDNDLGMEANPLLLRMMEKFDSLWMILIIKVALIITAWAFVYKFYEHEKHKSIIPAIIFVLVICTLVSILNYYLVLMI